LQSKPNPAGFWEVRVGCLRGGRAVPKGLQKIAVSRYTVQMLAPYLRFPGAEHRLVCRRRWQRPRCQRGRLAAAPLDLPPVYARPLCQLSLHCNTSPVHPKRGLRSHEGPNKGWEGGGSKNRKFRVSRRCERSPNSESARNCCRNQVSVLNWVHKHCISRDPTPGVPRGTPEYHGVLRCTPGYPGVPRGSPGVRSRYIGSR
jgi:hypothetical protein